MNGDQDGQGRQSSEKVAAAIAAVQAYLDEEELGGTKPAVDNALGAWKTASWHSVGGMSPVRLSWKHGV